MKNFNHTAKLKEFYSEYPYTHHIDPSINILLDLLYFISIYPTIHPFILLFDAFLGKFQTSAHLHLKKLV